MKWILLKIILRGCAVCDVLFADKFVLTTYNDQTGEKKAETKYSKADFKQAKNQSTK